MDPVPDFQLEIHRQSGKEFIILRVASGQETPYYYVGDGNHVAYLRIGNESVPADSITLKRLVLHGSNITFDSLVSPYPFRNYSFTRLRSAYLKRTGTELSDSDFISFDLADESGMLTYAGALPADESPVRYSRLFCTRWYGLDKASGVMEALDDKECSGSLVQNLDTDKVASRRRNPIIADIFSRMHYMERRGSGFRKIKTDYHNAINFVPELEPEFSSTPTSFFVTLYNLNYCVPVKGVEKAELSSGNQDFGTEKTELSIEHQDFEVILRNMKANKVTKLNILKLYRYLGSDSIWGRKDVMDIIGITATPASEFIRKLYDAGFTEAVSGKGKGKYHFKFFDH